MQKLKVELIRQKIAADLHDELGSNLSSMAFSAELAKKKLNGPGRISNTC
jgi:signal transduction histidine kinase